MADSFTLQERAERMRSFGFSEVAYADAAWRYVCHARPGTARSTASWRVVRVKSDNTEIEHAGTGQFEHSATDLATVQALFGS